MHCSNTQSSPKAKHLRSSRWRHCHSRSIDAHKVEGSYCRQGRQVKEAMVQSVMWAASSGSPVAVWYWGVCYFLKFKGQKFSQLCRIPGLYIMFDYICRLGLILCDTKYRLKTTRSDNIADFVRGSSPFVCCVRTDYNFRWACPGWYYLRGWGRKLYDDRIRWIFVWRTVHLLFVISRACVEEFSRLTWW